jgi:hypothetical protein
VLTARWNQARKLFTHDNLLAASLLDIVIAMTKGRPTATSTAPMIHRNKVADKILASDIVIPALMRNMFSPTLNSSWPIIILTRLFRYMIRAVSANVSTNEILVMPAQLDRAGPTVKLIEPISRLDVGQVNYLVI